MKNYIVCLKWGNKYGPEYVNKLFNMVRRNCNLPFEFVCFTENSDGIVEDVRIIPLQTKSEIKGWWYKPFFFSSNLPLDGTILFMDLDVIVFKNIDKLFTYKPKKFCIIKDFPIPGKNRTFSKMNSSVFRFQTGQYSFLYDELIQNPSIVNRFHGDQDWIYHKLQNKEYEFWPESWVKSYKWGMLNTTRLTPKYEERKLVYESKKEPIIEEENCISVFHGEPSPHNCIDPWVKQNWG